MRYHLYIADGTKCVEDVEGIDLPDLQSAVREAISSARELMADALRAGEPMNTARMFKIKNTGGDVLATVRFLDALT